MQTHTAICIHVHISSVCGSYICSTCFVISGFGFGGTAGASQTGVGGLGCLGGGLTAGQSAADATAAAIAQQNQQQLLQLTSSPYGDSPLFHNLRQVMSSFVHAAYFIYTVSGKRKRPRYFFL